MGADALAKRVLWGADRRLSYKAAKVAPRWLWPLLVPVVLTAGVATAVTIYAAILNPEGAIDRKVRQTLNMLCEAWRYLTT